MTASRFAGQRVVVTGGQGFIGSHLCDALLAEGAGVTSIDSLHPELGGRASNLLPRPGLEIVNADLRDSDAVAAALQGCQTVFHLAGQSGHARSMSHPREDLELNVDASLALMESCRRHAPGSLVVFSSTRQVYGAALGPLDESHPTNAPDVNAVHKLAVENHLALYGKQHGLRWTVLRLSNTYGPRQGLHSTGSGLLGTFLLRSLRGDPLQVFGSGAQRRVFGYVGDVVSGLIAAARHSGCEGHVWNLGGGEATSVADLARLFADLTNAAVEIAPFPTAQGAIDVGDHPLLDTRLREKTGWGPRVSLRAGLALTLEAFRVQPERLEPDNL